MSEEMAGTLILALGNPLRGDDGVGTAVLAALAEQRPLPAAVTLSFAGATGLLSALVNHCWQRVILVDSADIGRQPGEWCRFTLPAARLAVVAGESAGYWHRAGLAEVLALALPFATALPEIVIYGVQPATFEPGCTLSPPVRQAVPVVCSAILMEMSCDCEQAGEGSPNLSQVQRIS